jgi:hypothetical protein
VCYLEIREAKCIIKYAKTSDENDMVIDKSENEKITITRINIAPKKMEYMFSLLEKVIAKHNNEIKNFILPDDFGIVVERHLKKGYYLGIIGKFGEIDFARLEYYIRTQLKIETHIFEHSP